MSKNNFFNANWKVSPKVKTLITTKGHGADFGFNLALHVGDEIDNVYRNREILSSSLPSKPYWLNQTHSNLILDLDNLPEGNSIPSYDASITRTPGKVCVVMTADCLPIFLTDSRASFVAAVHAGWRGVENGIIAKTVEESKAERNTIIAYIGPAICQNHFEVGQEVLDVFTVLNSENNAYFTAKSDAKYLCDLAGIAKLQLLNLGVLSEHIFLSHECTYCNTELFYSYRKENKTGRFASCIWLD